MSFPMREDKIEIFFEQKPSEQELLRSLQSAAKRLRCRASSIGAEIVIDNWELVFDPPRQPVIIHALYEPWGRRC